MARKKRTKGETAETDQTTAAVAVAEPDAGNESAPVAGAEPEQPQRTWGDPYKAIFSSTAKGFEMGENRRFKQRVFKFTEKPPQEVIDVLKEHGFTYRPAEKAWTINANPDTRKLSEELAYQFAGETPGRSL